MNRKKKAKMGWNMVNTYIGVYVFYSAFLYVQMNYLLTSLKFTQDKPAKNWPKSCAHQASDWV